jgi:prephenate dehydrogenase
LEKITIIGLGLIGTSMGLAIKKSNSLNSVEIVGYDINKKHRSIAKKMGAIDKDEGDYKKAVQNSQLVIICTPVLSIREVFENISPHLDEGSIVTDTGSTKAKVHEWAKEILPTNINFIGGHPMAGREKSGPTAASADLFNNCTYAICPSINASSAAIDSVLGLVNIIGGNHYFIDSGEHDSYVAAISHLPFITATALMTMSAKSRGWREISKLAGSGFRDMSRLASGDPMMHRDICLTNVNSITHWINEFISELEQIRKTINGTSEEIEDFFIEAWESRAKWLKGEASEDTTEDLPKTGEAMMSMLMGDNLARHAGKLGKSNESDATYFKK